MDELTRQLRVAVSTPPPSRIDVNRLVVGDQRRRRIRLVTGVGVAVAAVALAPLALIVPGPGGSEEVALSATAPSRSADTALSAPASPRPTPTCGTAVYPDASSPVLHDTVRARPTEDPDDAVVRLTGVLRQMLSTRLPADIAVTGGRRPWECDVIEFKYDPMYQSYDAWLRLSRSGQTDYFRVTLDPTTLEQRDPCRDRSRHRDCSSTRLPDGAQLVSVLTRVGKFGHEQRSVLLLRTDGTTVGVFDTNLNLGNPPPGSPTEHVDPPMLSLDELAVLAQDPNLTLYP
jgi:hypothetical protein